MFLFLFARILGSFFSEYWFQINFSPHPSLLVVVDKEWKNKNHDDIGHFCLHLRVPSWAVLIWHKCTDLTVNSIERSRTNGIRVCLDHDRSLSKTFCYWFLPRPQLSHDFTTKCILLDILNQLCGSTDFPSGSLSYGDSLLNNNEFLFSNETIIIRTLMFDGALRRALELEFLWKHETKKYFQEFYCNKD